MEQEIPFRIFPLQRTGSSHISAVKPQAVVENTFQNLKSPHGIKTKSYMDSNSDYMSLKVPPIAIIEEENLESHNQLYSKLHREVEKIKKWKSNVEFEIKEKETKLQEKRNIIDAQKKIIQEIQFENGRLRLQLEDVIHENEDLAKQGAATRHLCNILKESFDRAAEKASIYENEIDDTRQFYSDLNNNIERMIMAFEELRLQAENSRQELYNQIRQDNENRQETQKEQNLELARCKKQILELTQDREDNENKILNLKLRLNESTNKIQELNQISENNQRELEKHKKKADEIITKLEASNLALQNTKNTLKSKENELLTAQTLLSDATKEKQLIVIELEETRSHDALQLSVLQSKVDSLEETLFTEQTRLKEREAQLEALRLEVLNKSSAVDEFVKTNENHRKEVEQFKSELENCITVEKELEKKLAGEKRENKILKLKEQDLLINQENLQDEIDTLNLKINTSSVDIDRYSKQIEELKTDVSQREESYLNLKNAYENILTEREALSKRIEEDITNVQKDLKACTQQRDQAMKKIENFEKTNFHLRQENESLKEQLKTKALECSTQHEDKKKHFETEFSKKEKQQKALENKLCTLKKQVENKMKTIEELQQENKSLKKKMKQGCKQCSVLEAKVNESCDQIENLRIQHENDVSSKQLEITDAKTKEETLHKEVERLKRSSEEALQMQRETHMKCQHKITEMMALMEKHKHQYDKLLEEKDVELGGLRAKEQEMLAIRETELSNKNNEIATLKKHLQQEKDQKEKMSFKSSTEHKEVQTALMDNLKQPTKIGNVQNISSFSVKTPQMSKGRKLDNENAFPWMSSKSSKSVVPKKFSVKTPLKNENVIIQPQGSAKKKRKVALEFDFHSDSSDPTDILGIYENESMLNSIYHMSHSTPKSHITNPRKILLEASLKSPSPVRKLSTIKKMRETGWAAISKVDRRRKMKAAEKIFS
ncbi:synaptonemal complex protein 1 [Leptodactylus fuscus]|uniref:synaptonemal complex protein 1 n=1 Tax=Leptodactylus fuscus TaxID=238119 RepID=UPI003F4E9A92